jgi:hypothetical protein
MEIKILLSGLPKEAPTTKERKPTLEERVDYAIDCISCGHNKGKAIDFLRKVKAHLEPKVSQSVEYQDLLNKVDVALADYGHYHIATTKEK